MGFANTLPQDNSAVVLDRMGDPLGERARFMLSGVQYPGDAIDCPDTLDADRFYLYQVSETDYVIMDKLCRLEPELTVPIALLTNPCFEIDRWYWRHMGLRRGFSKQSLKESERQRTWRPGSMGDALAEQAMYLLDSRADYPHDGPACKVSRRFECNFVGQGLYEVYDTALQFAASVPEKLLMNSKFRLPDWYAKRLTQGYYALQDAVEPWTCEWNL
ncbi:hypothetical protein C8R48DRAFT_597107, partial [Suillus tomentosus]